MDYNPTFRLYLCTRDASLTLPPSARALLATVNFSTTPAGLTGQLLTAALAHEKPELEKRKSELLKKEEEDKIQISRLEDFLLEQLAGSTGNILENRELLASLNETKHKSAAIEDSLKESTALQQKLEVEGNVYLPVAQFASKLFFLVSDLKKLENMYRFSLASFLRLFQFTLEQAEHAGSSGEKRIDALKNKLLRKVYDYVSRSLFKTDRLSFAMHLARGMHPDNFADNEWEAYLGIAVSDGGGGSRGGSAAAGGGGDSGSAPSWVEEERRPAAGRMRATLPALSRAAQLDDAGLWATFYNAEECEREFPVQVMKMSLYAQLGSRSFILPASAVFFRFF